MALINKLRNIANAIRSKTGENDTLTLDEMTASINGLELAKNSKSFVISPSGRISTDNGNNIEYIIYPNSPDIPNSSILDELLLNEPNNKSIIVSVIALGQLQSTKSLRSSIVSNKEIGINSNDEKNLWNCIIWLYSKYLFLLFH